MCLIGFSINISKVPNGVKYFGIFLCPTGSYAAFPGVVAWLLSLLSSVFSWIQCFAGWGITFQAITNVGLDLQIGIGNFSIAMSCNFYRSQDAPHYTLGHECDYKVLDFGFIYEIDSLELMFVAIGFIVVPIVVLSYVRINGKGDAAEKPALEEGKPAKYTIREAWMTGNRAPDFRYII